MKLVTLVWGIGVSVVVYRHRTPMMRCACELGLASAVVTVARSCNKTWSRELLSVVASRMDDTTLH